jgi:hypothetical protein
MKNNFSTPGFLWPLLTLVCYSTYFNRFKSRIKKNKLGKKHAEQNIFWNPFILMTWIGLLNYSFTKGFFDDFSKLPPRRLWPCFIPLPIIILIAFSKTGTQLVQTVPSHWLVFMQSFRIIVELLLLFAFMAGKLPVQMTFEGRNFDVVTGVLALPVGYLLARRKLMHQNWALLLI